MQEIECLLNAASQSVSNEHLEGILSKMKSMQIVERTRIVVPGRHTSQGGETKDKSESGGGICGLRAFLCGGLEVRELGLGKRLFRCPGLCLVFWFPFSILFCLASSLPVSPRDS